MMLEAHVEPPGSRAYGVALLRVDDELRRAIPAEELALAERAVVVEGYRLPAGPWEPESMSSNGASPSAALVIDGLVTLDIGLAGCATAHLRGPGDLIRPWVSVSHVLPAVARWTVSEGGAAIAVLGKTFERAERRWPGLAVAIAQRFADQADAAALRTAIASLPRVEQRVLALFWHLADRWGSVHADGVVVHLKLTHELIGRLVGAKRPTVSLALTDLAARGDLRNTDGGWRLSHESIAALDGALPPAARTAMPVSLRTAPPRRLTAL